MNAILNRANWHHIVGDSISKHAAVPESKEVNDDTPPKGRIFYLDARFEYGGVWAGMGTLVELAFLDLLDRELQDVLQAHNYELYMALPQHRDKIKLRYASLTDSAQEEEKTRAFPLDRAYRIVHGLVGLIQEWREICAEPDQWTVIVRRFDDAQHLASRFFAELARRSKLSGGIDVIVEAQTVPQQLSITSKAAPRWVDQLVLEPLPEYTLDKNEEDRLLTAVNSGSFKLFEEHYPLLLSHYRRNNQHQLAATIAANALSLYVFSGYYYEATALMDTVLPYINDIIGDNQRARWMYVIKLYSCLIGTGQHERAASIIEKLGMPYFTRCELRARAHYLYSIGHLRYTKTPDLKLAEKHILEAIADTNAAKGHIDSGEFHFLKVFIDNGLAFLRVRQGRAAEAVELCQAGYALLTRELGAHKHLLHRSVLLYNCAQVYSSLDDFDAAIEYFQKTIALDPYYSEYHNECANILQRMGRYSDALAAYSLAIEYSAPYPEVYFNRAICHLKLQEQDQALQDLKMCLELDPNQFDAYALRAEILDALGQETDALDDYDAAVALAPDAIEVRVNRAVIHFNRGKFDLALADMNHVISIDVGQASHYENRAEIYKAMHQSELYRCDIEFAEANIASATTPEKFVGTRP